MPLIKCSFAIVTRFYLAIAPQVKHYYRYGEFKDCKKLRENFSFCWNVRGKSEMEQHHLIEEREARLNYQKNKERPSRAVWEVHGINSS